MALRIKDSVDLKELEKFEFKEKEYRTPFGRQIYYIKERGISINSIDYKMYHFTLIYKNDIFNINSYSGTRILNFSDTCDCEEWEVEDLIQAGLIEKVEG